MVTNTTTANFIHQGEGLLTLSEEMVEVRKGAVAFVHTGAWHGLENTGKENLLMAFGYSPAGFEGYFRGKRHGRRFGCQGKNSRRIFSNCEEIRDDL